ncbi:amidase family protein, partial [Streptococcus hyovaginalis]
MFRDATDMAEAVNNRKVSAKELVLDTIDKVEGLNPDLNAITSTRFEKALMEAETRDFSDKPFAGVPIFLKDLGQEQEGEPSTSGSILFKDYYARQSDYYVERLEALGFIVLGRTNTPEFGFKNISDSRLHGPVNLPDDPTRNAGGSSGGAAAVVASGISPVAAASDGGGSIRIPASFNGLIGLKPTRGRIPVGPGSYRGWQGAS